MNGTVMADNLLYWNDDPGFVGGNMTRAAAKYVSGIGRGYLKRTREDSKFKAICEINY